MFEIEGFNGPTDDSGFLINAFDGGAFSIADMENALATIMAAVNFARERAGAPALDLEELEKRVKTVPVRGGRKIEL